MYKVAVVFFSTSRYEYLFPMLKSVEEFVDFSGVEVYKIFIDDYPKGRDEVLSEYIRKRYNIDHMEYNEKNMGYSVSWGKAWSLLPDDIDFIWHQEDDMEILEHVNVLDMINIMKNSPTPLYQLFLKRNVCYGGGNDFVYKIEEKNDGKEAEVNGQSIVMFRSGWFISHPGLYPRWVTKLKYDYNPQEGILPPVIRRHKPDSWGAILGKRKEKNKIQHIGEFNRGQKCIEGEPGWKTFGRYDQNKDYYSLKFLTEWKGSRNYEMAQLHLKYGTTEKVIEYYKKCLEEDRCKDRKYLACLYLADNLKFTSYLYKATEIYPERLEAWYRLMLNSKGNHVRYGYGRQGYDHLIKNRDATYFKMDQKVYDYAFIFEFSMIAYYAGNTDDIHEISQMFNKDKAPDSLTKQHENNGRFYVNSKVTKRSKYKAPSVIIVDNILDDPEKEREFALSQEYPISGNYPGTRTEGFATDKDKEMLETIMNKKITFWPKGGYNGSYQFCTNKMRSWIHRDRTTCSAMIYLTPDAPVTAGTQTYIHKKTGETFEKGNVNGVLDKDSHNFDQWDTLDRIGNQFNRLVIFQGIVSHKSSHYFGDDINNGRLFKVFFFNVEDALQ